MSVQEYFGSLQAEAKEQYLRKLNLLDLSVSRDPYAASNEDNFVDNMALWPSVEFGHIFCYFIERPGTYSKQELLQWKSLDAYKYFESGHVRAIKVWVVSSTCCILRALVNPSQRLLEKPHDAWVGLKTSGDIVAAHCTCMAG